MKKNIFLILILAIIINIVFISYLMAAESPKKNLGKIIEMKVKVKRTGWDYLNPQYIDHIFYRYNNGKWQVSIGQWIWKDLGTTPSAFPTNSNQNIFNGITKILQTNPNEDAGWNNVINYISISTNSKYIDDATIKTDDNERIVGIIPVVPNENLFNVVNGILYITNPDPIPTPTATCTPVNSSTPSSAPSPATSPQLPPCKPPTPPAPIPPTPIAPTTPAVPTPITSPTPPAPVPPTPIVPITPIVPTPTTSPSGGGSGGGSGNSFTTIAAPNLDEHGPQDWKVIGKNITNILAGIAQILLVIMLMYGGVSYITSAGNEEQANKAKGVLTNAIIGTVIVAASWGIITYIISRLGSLG